MNVLSFQHFRKRGELPRYLGVRYQNPEDAEKCFQLGSRLMRWSDEVLLLDLGSVRSYWSWHAKKKGIEIDEYFEKLLKYLFPKARSAFAHHPWQCLIFLYQESDIFNGEVFSLGSPQGKAEFERQEFSSWELPLNDLESHLPQKERAKFRQVKGRFFRFLERMMLSRAFEVKDLDEEGMERRFGPWWGKIWEWTFEGLREKKVIQRDLFSEQRMEANFPWKSIEFKRPLLRKRNLDFPLLEWAPMEELIKEDLKIMLQDFEELQNEQILSVTWRVTLDHLRVFPCSIQFRNPHSLIQDAPEFKTFLSQAYYSYQNMIQSLEEESLELEYPINHGLLSWEFVVEETMRSHGRQHDLFSEVCSGGLGQFSLLDLENRLPRALDSYSLKDSFYPEGSFGKRGEFSGPDQLGPWSVAAKRRPLFIYKEPRELESNKSMRRIFLERVSSRWWLGKNPSLGERDYYLVEDEKGKLIWAYQDQEGKWYQHGLFS